ncbi:iron-containing alcohol dehydrogenase [Alicyclobacillus ferrooxydans]|uniref:iron-containing alcohol dehydrogenase n=1 Tax=Alicyclobacillus ferrooxydans TaxID=471514 RepID=UPI0006D5A650|nr:iron-containing alcohol dehydrogenase [Alicyclobacillus ferrooxydans]
MLEVYQHHIQTRIVSGERGLLTQCGPELEVFRHSRAGLVTDKVIVSLGFVEQLSQSLGEAGIELVSIFSEVPQDSDVDTVTRVADLFQAANCNLLIALGGGSVIDTAKAANILLTHGGDLLDYQGAEILTSSLLPLIAIPTTVGTGSEVTSVAVIADRTDHRKLTFVDKSLAPTIALLDPAVTSSLPNGLLAMTAMDALTHALEAYIDVLHNPFSDAWAVTAATLIRQNLQTALGDPASEVTQSARASLQTASTMAGIAFQHSMVGVVHAVAHALGGVAGVPHGLANALMLTEGLRCNAEVEGTRITEIGRLSGFGGDGQEAVIQAIDEFRRDVLTSAGLPLTLAGARVTADMLPLIVERASEDGTMIYNPKYVDVDELAQMVQNVFE